MGMRELAFDRRIQIRATMHRGRAGQGSMPTGWANTAAAIAYQYQFCKNSGMFFSQTQMEAYKNTRSERDMDELRKIYLSHFFAQLRSYRYTIDQARVLCYVFYDVVEVMFLEKLKRDVVNVHIAQRIPAEKHAWGKLELEVTALFIAAKGAVSRRILNYHNPYGFSQNNLCYASFSSKQIDGSPVRMGQHGYAGSIYFPNGRIRLIHGHGPSVSQHNAVVRTVGNRKNERENVIIELQDSAAVLSGKVARIPNPHIYEYEQATLNQHVNISIHGRMIRRRIGIRRPVVPGFGWDKLSLAQLRQYFHVSRGIPRKAMLNGQQIEALFFIGDSIKQMLRHPPAGASEIAEAGNRFVLEYLDMNRELKKNLGYSM